MAAILDVSRQGTVSYVEDHCLRVTAMLKLALRRTLRGHCCASCSGATREQIAVRAGVAQLVEHLICNQRVGGSNPFASSSLPARIVGSDFPSQRKSRDQQASFEPEATPKAGGCPNGTEFAVEG